MFPDLTENPKGGVLPHNGVLTFLPPGSNIGNIGKLVAFPVAGVLQGRGSVNLEILAGHRAPWRGETIT